MQFEVSLFVFELQSTEVLEGSSVAIHCDVLPNLQEIRQMEIFLHEEGNIDSCNGEEETRLVSFHLLHEGFLSLDEPQDQL